MFGLIFFFLGIDLRAHESRALKSSRRETRRGKSLKTKQNTESKSIPRTSRKMYFPKPLLKSDYRALQLRRFTSICQRTQITELHLHHHDHDVRCQGSLSYMDLQPLRVVHPIEPGINSTRVREVACLPETLCRPRAHVVQSLP